MNLWKTKLSGQILRQDNKIPRKRPLPMENQALLGKTHLSGSKSASKPSILTDFRTQKPRKCLLRVFGTFWGLSYFWPKMTFFAHFWPFSAKNHNFLRQDFLCTKNSAATFFFFIFFFFYFFFFTSTIFFIQQKISQPNFFSQRNFFTDNFISKQILSNNNFY